ncbi:MAG: hypothetical protein ACPHCN_09375 [Mycobacterium sp.]
MQYGKDGAAIASGPWKVLRKLGFAGAESAPSAELDALKTSGAKSSAVVWLVVPPSGATAYTVTFGRWVRTDEANGDRAFNQWVDDESVEVTVTDEPLIYRQAHYGDPVQCYVSALTGGAAAGTVLFKTAG